MNNFQKYFIVALLIAAVGVWYVVWAEGDKNMYVHFLDVGQGDAAFVRFPNNNQLLIDGGPSALILSRLGEIMPFYDRSIDALLVTHSDSDHLSGMLDVLDRYEVSMVFEPTDVAQNNLYALWQKKLAEKQIPVYKLRAGQRIVFDNNAVFDVLFPFSAQGRSASGGEKAVQGNKSNNKTIVGKLRHLDNTFLFMADAEKLVEIQIARFFDLAADVLKVGHHGSKTSTSNLLLARSRPQAAVVSAGKANRYGHPHQEVAARLLDSVSHFFRTDEQGTVVVKSTGIALEFQTKK